MAHGWGLLRRALGSMLNLLKAEQPSSPEEEDLALLHGLGVVEFKHLEERQRDGALEAQL